MMIMGGGVMSVAQGALADANFHSRQLCDRCSLFFLPGIYALRVSILKLAGIDLDKIGKGSGH